MRKIVTRESMIKMLENEALRERVIGRALVALMKRQTEAERESNTTQNHNLRGFMPCDAKHGTISAKTFIKRKALIDFQVEHWMEPTAKGYPRIVKYVRQLNEIANEKVAA